jgi:hypothetical protein
METAPSRRNDAQDRAFSFPLFLAKRRPSKAAVQAFKDSQNKKSVFLDATHTMGGPLLRSWTSLSCAGF